MHCNQNQEVKYIKTRQTAICVKIQDEYRALQTANYNANANLALLKAKCGKTLTESEKRLAESRKRPSKSS